MNREERSSVEGDQREHGTMVDLGRKNKLTSGNANRDHDNCLYSIFFSDFGLFPIFTNSLQIDSKSTFRANKVIVSSQTSCS